MISRDAFAQEVRSLTDTAFAVAYLILGNRADCEDAMSEAILRAYEHRDRLKKRDCGTKPTTPCASGGG